MSIRKGRDDTNTTRDVFFFLFFSLPTSALSPPIIARMNTRTTVQVRKKNAMMKVQMKVSACKG